MIKSKVILKEVKTKIWMDIIFVNINSNEIDFDEYIKPLEQRWSKFINKEDQKLIVHSNDYGYFNLEVNVTGSLLLKIIVKAIIYQQFILN